MHSRRIDPIKRESIRAAVEKKQLSLPPLPASFFQVNEADYRRIAFGDAVTGLLIASCRISCGT